MSTLKGENSMHRNPVYWLAETKKLPAGHYDKKAAQDAVDKEYALTRIAEKEINVRLHKRQDLPRYFKNLSTAFEICNAICDYWQIKRVKAIVLGSSDVCETAEAHYCMGEIHFKYFGFSLITLIHELAHHFARLDKNNAGHGKDFVMYENMITDTFLELF